MTDDYYSNQSNLRSRPDKIRPDLKRAGKTEGLIPVQIDAKTVVFCRTINDQEKVIQRYRERGNPYLRGNSLHKMAILQTNHNTKAK